MSPFKCQLLGVSQLTMFDSWRVHCELPGFMFYPILSFTRRAVPQGFYSGLFCLLSQYEISISADFLRLYFFGWVLDLSFRPLRFFLWQTDKPFPDWIAQPSKSDPYGLTTRNGAKQGPCQQVYLIPWLTLKSFERRRCRRAENGSVVQGNAKAAKVGLPTCFPHWGIHRVFSIITWQWRSNDGCPPKKNGNVFVGGQKKGTL